MNYYIYIDESGPFSKNSSEKSIVGGIISTHKIYDYILKLENIISDINKTFNVNFTLKDIHTAALLHPENARKTREKTRFSAISQDARNAFISACLDIVKSYADDFIYSVDDYFEFGTETPQNAYGQVLSALIHEIISYMQLQNNAETLQLFIAPRSESCLNTTIQPHLYHENLVKYITDLITQKLPDIKVYVNSILKQEDIQKGHKIGYDFADVACYYLRKHANNDLSENKLPEDKIIRTKPNDISAQHYNYHNNIVYKKLIDNNALESAYRIYKPKREEILNQLEKIEDNTVFKNQLFQFLSIGEELLEKRTSIFNAIEDAKLIFEKLALIAVDKFHSVEKKERGQYLKIYLSAVKGGIACENHTGQINNQKEFEKYISNAVSQFGKFLTDETTLSRQELILRIKNTAYNDYANNYRFQEIINEFKDTVDERVSKGFDDDLTGETLGTIGQAYAFSSKLNPEYSTQAESYFLKSLDFFIEDSPHHQMSINFLTILAWYSGNLEQAKKYFTMRPIVSEGKSLATWAKSVIAKSENQPGKPFDVSIILRLLALEQTGAKKIIALTEDYIHPMNKIKEHPFELIYKWLGINYLLLQNYKQAIHCFDKSLDITADGFFTLQTISIPVLGLKAIALLKDKKQSEADSTIQHLNDSINSLTGQSPYFGEYISSIGGREQMLDDINNLRIINTAKWLPFSYA